MSSLTTFPPKAAPERDWKKLLETVVLDRASGRSLHVQLSAVLRRFILSTLADGEKFLPEAKLVDLLGLSLGTVRRALTVLTEEGLLERKRHHGTVTRKPAKDRMEHLTLVLSHFDAVFFNYILDALTEQAQSIATSTRIVRLRVGQDWKDLSRHINYPPAKGGVVLIGNDQQVTIDLNATLSQQGYRTVSLGPLVRHYPGNYVGVSNRSFIEYGLKKLAELGHRKIAFLVGEPEERDEVQERVRLFQEISAEMKLTEVEVFHAGTHEGLSSIKKVVQLMPQIWEGKRKPTAIFAISDTSGVGALQWFNSQHISVPQEVSILSYDGSDWTRQVVPEISSLTLPVSKMVSEVFRMMLSENTGVEHILVPPGFQPGETLAPPR